jgi:xanthine dehydrogenase YagR molybdenum-binding subunit
VIGLTGGQVKGRLRDRRAAIAADRQSALCAVSIADVMRHGKAERIEKRKDHTFKDLHGYARNTHSAAFIEVKVDGEIGIFRVTRAVSAVAAGRILNPKTAGSRVMGSVVGGIGSALHEETLIDHRIGRSRSTSRGGEGGRPCHDDM